MGPLHRILDLGKQLLFDQSQIWPASSDYSSYGAAYDAGRPFPQWIFERRARRKLGQSHSTLREEFCRKSDEERPEANLGM